MGLGIQQFPKKQVTKNKGKKEKTATMVTSYTVSPEKRTEQDPIKASFENQVETQEVPPPPSNVEFQLWKFLIRDNHQPVCSWSMTTNGTNRGAKKALLWHLQQPQMPQTF